PLFVINGFQRGAIVFNAGNVVLRGFYAGVGGCEFSDFFACGGIKKLYDQGFIQVWGPANKG
ncbi:MAG: hypothetical protein ACKV1O_24490, partial [Saprospiraceae bacterium]